MKLYIPALAALVSLISFNAYSQQSSQVEEELRAQLEAANTRLNKIKQQEANKKIWGRGRYLHLGYDNAQTAITGEPIEKSDYSFHLTKGTSFYLPKNPIANVLKFGIDVQWFDINFAKFSGSKIVDDNWNSMGNVWDDEDDELEFLGDLTNLGRYSISGGMGIGPMVAVAPFGWLHNEASRIKASFYFHWKPTATGFMVSEDGDTEISWAYCNMFDLGAKLTWRFIGVGIEGWWGKGKFKPVSFDFMGSNSDIYGEEAVSDKIERKFASTRFYVYFNF